MNSLFPAALVLAGFLAFLTAERRALSAARRRIPRRVAVTGTRGKSSVTRLIAAALRGDGRTVLAKTTGSKPVLIGTDGGEREIVRPGPPSILEQKRVLRAAALARADALVVEMMGIRPECLRAEAALILKPDVLVITNVRIDHREEMGRTRDAVAASLSAAIGPGSIVILPAGEDHPAFHAAARSAGARILLVPEGTPEGGPPDRSGGSIEFSENYRLAAAAAEALGVPGERAAAGMAGAGPDFGALRIWRLAGGPGGPGGPVRYAVNAFAANEPESTRRALDRLAAARPGLPNRRIGILNLREDREDRTRQWLEAAGAGFFAGFAGIAVLGRQAAPVVRRLRRRGRPGQFILEVPGADARRIMAAVEARAGAAAVFIGLGNIGGAGAALIDHWDRVGEAA